MMNSAFASICVSILMASLCAVRGADEITLPGVLTSFGERYTNKLLDNVSDNERVQWGQNFGEAFRETFVETSYQAIENWLLGEQQTATPEHRQALSEFQRMLDSKASIAEVREMWRVTCQRMDEFEGRMARLEYEAAYLRRDISRNKALIEHVDLKLERHRAEFVQTIEAIRTDLSSLRTGLVSLETDLEEEIEERRLEDEIQSREISNLKRLITPKTSRQIASVLGSKAATILIHNGDPAEAVTLLQLAMAYDKRENKFADPGLRYYLAVAYKRTGQLNLANEALMDGIVAQRFRELPSWYRNRTEFFQGPDRKWLRDAQHDPRFGVQSPREPVTGFELIPRRVEVPSRPAVLVPTNGGRGVR